MIKKILTILSALFLIPLTVSAASYFGSNQLGPSQSNGYVLQTNGNNVNTWVSTSSLGIIGGSGSPGGSNTQVQLNSNGTFGASSNFTFASSSILSIVGQTIAGGNSTGSTSPTISLLVPYSPWSFATTSPIDTGAQEGYAWDGTNNYVSSQNNLTKYNNTTWGTITSNSNPQDGDIGVNHVGGIKAYNGFIFGAVEYYGGCGSVSNESIFTWTTGTGLPFAASTSISAYVDEASGIALDTADNLIYISTYCSSKIAVFSAPNLSTASPLSGLTFLKDVTFTPSILYMQDVAYSNDVLYISSGNGTQTAYLYAANPNTGGNELIVNTPPVSSEAEGDDIKNGTIGWLLNNTGYVYFMQSVASTTPAFEVDSSSGSTTVNGNLNINGSLFGAGLSACNTASTSALTWNGGMFGCNTITASSSGSGTVSSSTAGYIGYYASGGTTISGIATSSVQYGLQNGLILDIPFSEGIGSTTYDLSPNHSSGTLCYFTSFTPATCTAGVSPTWTKGAFGNGIYLSGATGQADIILDPNDIYGGLNNITINEWFLSTSTFASQQNLISKHFSGGTGSWSLAFNNSTQLQFFMQNQAGTRSTWIATTPNISDSKWHMATAVYNGTTGSTTMYLDGSQLTDSCSTGCPLTGPIQTNTYSVVIGSYNDDGSFWVGSLDNSQIWNRPLTAGEIGTLYTPASNLTLTNLILTGIATSSFLATDSNGNVIATTTPSGGSGITSLAGVTNSTITLNGTANEILVATTSNSITLSTPQAIGTASAVKFGTLAVGASLQSGYTSSIIAANSNLFYLHDSGASYASAVIDAGTQANGSTFSLWAGGIPFWSFGKTGASGDFGIMNSQNLSTDFTISSSTGNIGISTSTPATALDVNGDITDENLKGSPSFIAVDKTGKLIATTTPSGGGAVSSVSNSDGTLTISPTTGSVVASLNLGANNIWTGAQNFTTSAQASTYYYGDGLFLTDGSDNLYAPNGLYDSNDSLGSADQCLVTNGSQVQWNNCPGATQWTNGLFSSIYYIGGNVGLGTSTPNAQLSIFSTPTLASTTHLFDIATSSVNGKATSTLMQVLGSGEVNIGSSTSENAGLSEFTITNNNIFGSAIRIYNSTNSSIFSITNGGTLAADQAGFTGLAVAGTGSGSAVIATLTGSTGQTADLLDMFRKTGVQTDTFTNNGWEGIGSTTPGSLLSIATSSSAAGTTSMFAIASSTAAGLSTTTLFQILGNGHTVTSGATPTVSGGTSSMNSPSNDDDGSINVVGTALTSVTMTFAYPWATAPVCTESDNQTAIGSDITSISTTQVVFGFGTGGVTSATIWYQCTGVQ